MNATDRKPPARRSRRPLWAIGLGLTLCCSCATTPATSRDDAPRRSAAETTPWPTQCAGQTGGNGPAWLRDGVGYQVWVRAFADSDGDGVGDLEGIRARLDYLNDGKPGGDDLGVTILWLSPIFASPSAHGYDTVNHRAIAPDIGTKADLKALINACHKRGIRLVLDLVLNHVSVDHPWFKAAAADPSSPKRRWFSWSATNRGWKQPWGNAQTWHRHRDSWYYGLFWSGMPDLNFTEPRVVEEMTAVITDWLIFGVDGFRLDAARYLVETGAGSGQADTPQTHALWRAWRKLADEHGERALIGEVWTKTATVRAYLGGDELHQCFDFEAAGGLRQGLALRSSAMWRKALCASLGTIGGSFGRFAGNHDMARLAGITGGGDRHKLALAAVLLTGATPWLYYGDEIATRSGKAPGDRAWRLPVPWSDFESQRKDRHSVWRWAQSLVELRAHHQELRRGPLRVLQLPAEQALDGAALALGPASESIVAFNFSDDHPLVLPPRLVGARNAVARSKPAPENQPETTLPAASVAVFR